MNIVFENKEIKMSRVSSYGSDSLEVEIKNSSLSYNGVKSSNACIQFYSEDRKIKNDELDYVSYSPLDGVGNTYGDETLGNDTRIYIKSKDDLIFIHWSFALTYDGELSRVNDSGNIEIKNALDIVQKLKF